MSARYDKARKEAQREREQFLDYLKAHGDLIADDLTKLMPPGMTVEFEIADAARVGPDEERG